LSSLLTYDGPHLEELLGRVRNELGAGVTIIEANRTRRGGIAGFFAKEWFEVVVSLDDAAEVDAAEVETAQVAVDPLLAMASAVDDVAETGATVRSEHRSAPALGHSANFALALAAAQREAAPIPAAVAAMADRTVPRSRAPELLSQDVSSAATHAEDATRPSVVPAPATRRLRDLDLADLLTHLDGMVPPDPLPSGPRSVIAIVGDSGAARAVASRLAVRLGLDESDVIVASPDRRSDVPAWLAVHAPDDIVARSERWRSAGHPTLVAVECAPGRDGHAWAASMLRALDADQVRLVAKAWQLADQLSTKAAALGEVDGVDLVEVDAAAEPELFLEIDLAVLGIDGRPATSELWAALLFERRTDGRNA
jgi:hypothetical protein